MRCYWSSDKTRLFTVKVGHGMEWLFGIIYGEFSIRINDIKKTLQMTLQELTLFMAHIMMSDTSVISDSSTRPRQIKSRQDVG